MERTTQRRMRRLRKIAREGLNDFLCLVSRPAIGQALCVPWGETASYVHSIPDIFCTGTRTIPDRASVHTHQRGFRREVAPGQSRRWRVGISNSFCVRLWCSVKQVFGPSRKWISRKEDWSPLRRKWIFMSKEYELVHQTFTFNRSGTIFDVYERLVPVLCAPLLAVYTTPADMKGCPV